MSDHLVSLIRTAVPVGVGTLLAWLAAQTGIVLDESSSAKLTAGVVGLTIVVYYTGVRALESRWPWFGVLLGKREAPTYGLPPAEMSSETELDAAGNIKVIRSVTTWPPKAT